MEWGRLLTKTHLKGDAYSKGGGGLLEGGH